MRSLIILLAFAVVFVAAAAVPHAGHAENTIAAGTASPGVAGEPVAPGVFVSDFYDAALALGGLIGFGALVYGAVMYSVAGGNSAAAGEARDQITQALLGLVLLFGAYLILQTINPSLVANLDLPKLEGLTVPPEDSNIAPLGTGKCLSGDCVQLTGIPGVSCSNPAQCGADSRVTDRLSRCVADARAAGKPTPSLIVTGAMPPGIYRGSHNNPHENGCAIDTVPSGDCVKVQEAIQFLQNCGFSVVNENPSCGGKRTTYWTGSHIHVQGC